MLGHRYGHTFLPSQLSAEWQLTWHGQTMGDEQAVNWILGRGRSSGKAGKAGKDVRYVSIWKYIHAAWGGSLQKKQWASWVSFWLARYRQCLSWISVKFDGKRQTKSCHWSLSCFSVVYENRTKALPQVNGCESKLATNWLMKRFSTKGSF